MILMQFKLCERDKKVRQTESGLVSENKKWNVCLCLERVSLKENISDFSKSQGQKINDQTERKGPGV